MKTKYLMYAALPTLATLTLGLAGTASAHGMFGMGLGADTQLNPDQIANHQQAVFQGQANLLGVSLDVIKNGWAAGKTLGEIAKENNITPEQLQAKMKEAHLAQMKARLKVLVDKGIITQAQADARVQAMQTKQENHGKEMKKHAGIFNRFHMDL